MRLIDADRLKLKIQFRHNVSDKYGDHDVYRWVWEGDINIEPTVDAVPVVRCKNCKYRPVKMNSFRDVCPPFGIPREKDETCPEFHHGSWMAANIPPDDFFCAYGEEKDG